MAADASELRPLGLARAAFGAVFLLRTTGLLQIVDAPFLRGAGPLLGWPDGHWHAPLLGLTLPAVLVATLCILRTVAALALALGIRTRVAGITAGVTGYLVLAQDAFGYLHHLHMLYLGAILLGLVDAGAAFAVQPTPARAPASSLLLVRAWVASIYWWAAAGKLRADWLDGRALALFRTNGGLQGRLAEALFSTPARCAALAVGVVVIEAALGPALLWRRTRTAALFVALVMHAVFEVVGRVDSIGWQMAALLLVFLPVRERTTPTPPATR